MIYSQKVYGHREKFDPHFLKNYLNGEGHRLISFSCVNWKSLKRTAFSSNNMPYRQRKNQFIEGNFCWAHCLVRWAFGMTFKMLRFNTARPSPRRLTPVQQLKIFILLSNLDFLKFNKFDVPHNRMGVFSTWLIYQRFAFTTRFNGRIGRKNKEENHQEILRTQSTYTQPELHILCTDNKISSGNCISLINNCNRLQRRQEYGIACKVMPSYSSFVCSSLSIIVCIRWRRYHLHCLAPPSPELNDMKMRNVHWMQIIYFLRIFPLQWALASGGRG